MHIYRWVKGDKVPERIQELIKISHEGGHYAYNENYNGGHFESSIRTCVLYILENNSLVCLGIGTQYTNTVERHDIWNFDDNKNHLFIDHLWTHPKHRCKGYGTNLNCFLMNNQRSMWSVSTAPVHFMLKTVTCP